MPLSALLEVLGRAADVDELRGDFLARARKHFGAARGAIFLESQRPPGMRRTPLIDYVMAHHAPMSSDALPAHAERRASIRRSDHGHALLGPLVFEGQLQGVLAFTRHEQDAAFASDELADLTALCLHVSALLAEWAARDKSVLPQLSARERQICQRVARGHTNAQIAAQLCVSPETVKAHLKTIFRKCDVRSRAQLAALSSR